VDEEAHIDERGKTEDREKTTTYRIPSKTAHEICLRRNEKSKGNRIQGQEP